MAPLLDTAPQTLLDIAIEELLPDPSQPRKTFLDQEIALLAASIRVRGVLTPLRVRRDDSRQCYHVITGESRLRAGKLAGRKTMPCLVVTGGLSETDILSDQITENTLRNALRPTELARSLSKLKALKKCTAQELAAELGMSGSSFSRAEALLSLPDEIQAMVDSGAVPESIAYEISRLNDEAAQFELAHAVAGKRMTRKQVKESVKDRKSGKKPRSDGSRITYTIEADLSVIVSAAQPVSVQALTKVVEGLRREIKRLQEEGKEATTALRVG